MINDIVIFSGGLDSSLVLYKVLEKYITDYKRKERLLTIVYCKSGNINKIQQKNEKKAIKKILKFFKKKYDYDIESCVTTVDISITENLGNDRCDLTDNLQYPRQFSLIAFSTLAFIKCKETIYYTGAIADDSINYTEITEYFNKFIKAYLRDKGNVTLQFPLLCEGYHKQDVIVDILNKIPDIIEYAYFCECYEHDKFCKCDSCKLFKTALIKIILSYTIYNNDLMDKLMPYLNKYGIDMDTDLNITIKNDAPGEKDTISTSLTI